MGMLHIVQTQQAQYTLARDDDVAYVLLAQASSEFLEPQSALCVLILYDQLFQEIKTLII
jgi:fructoselysine-6-P-deglycase FrlB-like protein